MKNIVIVIILLTVISCIKNDVPYPVIFGNVEKFEVVGQQECQIDRNELKITLTLSDTVDIYNVKVSQFSIVEEGICELDTSKPLDLSKPVTFNIVVFQDTYKWTIETIQEIDRYWTIENQIGQASINTATLTAIAYIPEGESRRDVKVLDLKLGPSIATYDPDPLTLTNFLSSQKVKVNCFDRTEEWTLYVLTSSIVVATAEASDIWAKSAVLNANMQSGNTATPGFQYRKSSSSNWIDVDSEDIKISGGTFSVKIRGLDASTDYVFRAFLGNELGEEVSFTTEDAKQIPNSNFDNWCYSDNDVLYPNIDLSEENYWWDSGNKGAKIAGKIPTQRETTQVIKGSAAKLEGNVAMNKLTAGNIFLGTYVENVIGSSIGGKLNFGRPYTCRPTTLSGYFKYTPGIINQAEGDYKYLIDLPDTCHIYIALCDWSGPFEANTATGTLVDYSKNNSSIIAFGELKESRTMNSYEKFTIELEYRNTTKKPTYIVLVASSSKYGDFFTGSSNSLLLLDEFELGFD